MSSGGRSSAAASWWVSTIEVTPFDRKVSIRGATNWRAARSSTEPAFPHTAGHPPPHATTFPDPPSRHVVLACRRVRVAPPDRHLRGAARAALGVIARGDARPDHRLRRHPRPPARVLARLRAGPGFQDQAELRRVRPQRLSGGQVGQPRRPDRGRQGQGRAGHADAHRPGPEVGDQEQEGQPHGPGPEGVRRVRDRDRAPLRRRREHLVDLERAQPAAVPQAAVQERQAGSRRSSTASSTRPPTRACARRRRTRATRS